MDYRETELVNNKTMHNFELIIEGRRSFIDYKTTDDKVHLIHTEVPKELQGKGVAAILVEKTFQYLEEHRLKVVPSCSYIQHFLKRHPRWKSLVAE